MRVRYRDLPPDAAARLADAAAGRQAGQGIFCRRQRRAWLAWFGVPVTAAGAFSLWVLVWGGYRPASAWEAALPWAGLLLLAYGLLALAEYLRVLAAAPGPFLLLTPYNLVQSPGAGRPLELFRLAEASSFRKVEEYSGASWKGLRYDFQFDGGRKANFSLRERSEIEAADLVLALARLAGRGEALPDCPGRRFGPLATGACQDLPRDGIPGQLLNPVSETWILGWVALIVVMMAWAFFR